MRTWEYAAALLVLAALLGWLIAAAQERAVATQLVIEPEAGVAPLLRYIGEARSRLDGEIFLITSEDVLRALERAAGRGVHVRLLLEQHPFGRGRPSPENTFRRLQERGVDVRWAPESFRYTHAKFLLREDGVSWVGTMNWSVSSFTRNRDFALVDGDRAATRQLAAVFEADWRREALAADVSRLVVSPVNARRRLGALINSARTRLDVYAQVLRDPAINTLLCAAARRGVRVRVVWSGNGKVAELLRSGVEVVIITTPYPHAKAAIADASTMYLGSVNFTATSLDLNREVGLITQDAGATAGVERAFEADFAAGTPVAEAHKASSGI